LSYRSGQNLDIRSYRGGLRISRSIAAEIAILVLLTLAVLGPFMTVKGVSDGGGGEGSALRQFGYLFIFCMTIWASRAMQDLRRFLVLPLSLALPLLWCWISISWAIEPGIAIRRLTLTTILILAIFMAVRQCGVEKTVSIVCNVLAVVLVVNFLTVILMPSYGIHQFANSEDPSIIGAWRGIMLQKNFAGATCAMTLIFYLFETGKIPRLQKWSVIVGTVFFLYHTESKTSMGVFAITASVGYLSRFYGARFRWAAAMAAAALIGLVLILAHIYWDVISAPFATDDAFTGRTQIWPVMLAFYHDHWLTGAGYGSFWNIGDDSPIYHYAKQGSWVANITSGHNGYLDLLVQIGLPGWLLAIAGVFVAPLIRVFSIVHINKSVRGMLVAGLLFCIGHNFTESTLLDRDQVVEIFLMLTLAMISTAAMPRRSIDSGTRWQALPTGMELPQPAAASSGDGFRRQDVLREGPHDEP
jgi:O-antigen ligase